LISNRGPARAAACENIDSRENERHDFSVKVRVACALFLAGLSIAGTSSRGADAAGDGALGEGSLTGIFYDLKETQQKKPSGVDPGEYERIVEEYLAKNWDEDVLNRYYQVSKPLNTTQIFIPLANSDLAPKVFGLENTDARPNLWVAHYKAEVSPPEAGTYRFVGTGDDIIAVAVDGKTVLSSFGTWKPSEPNGPKAGSFLMVHGDWMTLKADQIIDLDVIFGDEPGAVFDAFLMIQKQGVTYKMDQTGHPILPIFQVAPYVTPVVNDINIEPPFATGFPIWKAMQ
jgi:hypothetical protein